VQFQGEGKKKRGGRTTAERRPDERETAEKNPKEKEDRKGGGRGIPSGAIGDFDGRSRQKGHASTKEARGKSGCTGLTARSKGTIGKEIPYVITKKRGGLQRGKKITHAWAMRDERGTHGGEGGS